MHSRRRGFGHLRRLPSGRYQASYIGPDGSRHLAPTTFQTRRDADAWLAEALTAITRKDWRRTEAVRVKQPSFAQYSGKWMLARELRPRTVAEYRKLLTNYLLPEFGPVALDKITSQRVRDWHARLAEVTGPTQRSHAYGLLRAILTTAVADEMVSANPCRVRGAGGVRRARSVQPATLGELGVIVSEMPEEYQAAVLISAWLGLRFGEVAELRRRDVDLMAGRIKVLRAVTVVDGEFIVGPPKTDAGVREIAIPPHLLPALEEHLVRHVNRSRDELLFEAPTGGHLRSDGKLHRSFHRARALAGRPDLRWHDLRHTGATLAAATGATLAELMHRLGHATPVAAMRYQHATADRDAAIASALSEFAASQVVSLRPRSS